MVANASGKICYVELPAADAARSAEFYRAVFGWKIRTRGDGRTAFDDGVEVSGLLGIYQERALSSRS